MIGPFQIFSLLRSRLQKTKSAALQGSKWKVLWTKAAKLSMDFRKSVAPYRKYTGRLVPR